MPPDVLSIPKIVQQKLEFDLSMLSPEQQSVTAGLSRIAASIAGLGRIAVPGTTRRPSQ